MEAASIIIVSLMGLGFLFCLIIIIVGTLYDRRATRKQRQNHQSYFRQ